MRFKEGSEWAGKDKDTSDDFDPELIKTMIGECQDHMAMFNSWEEEFMTSILEQIENKKRLSVRQREIIGNMHDKMLKRRR